MAELQTKTLTANGSKGHHKFTLTVKELSIDPVNNTSTINYIFKISPIQTGWDWSNYSNITFDVTVGNSSYIGYISDYDGKSTVTKVNQTFTQKHNDDGNETINISFSVSDKNTSVTYTPGNASKSGTMELTFIPRKSSILANDGVLGKAQTLFIDYYSESFTHTVTYKCGTATGTIATKTDKEALSFTPPLALASQNKSGTNVSLILYTETFNGDDSIGTTEKTINCEIPASVKPSLYLSVADSTGAFDTYGKYVQGVSALDVSLVATESYGAEIKSYNASFDGKSYTESEFITAIINGSGNLTLSGTVKDSRGRSATDTMAIAVLSYSKPKISALKVYRSNSSGDADSGGAYLTAEITASVSPLDNKNSAKYTLNYKKSSEANYTVDEVESLTGLYSVSGAKVTFPADTGSSYDIKLIVEDDFNEIPQSAIGLSVKKLWSWLYNGFGWAFGKVAELNGWLDIALKTIFRDEINVNSQTMYGVKTPENDTEAANKDYVDAATSTKMELAPIQPMVSGQDANNYKTAGQWRVGDNSIAANILNLPVAQAGTLTVNINDSYYPMQSYRTWTGIEYTRYYNGDKAAWSNWAKTMTNRNITAAYSVLLSFANGKATYSNSAITANSIVIVQRCSGSVGNNQSFNVSSNAGSVTICTDSSISMNMNINIIIINL